MKKIISSIFIGILLLLLVMGYKTIQFTTQQNSVEALPEENLPPLAVEHFAEAIRIQTVSPEHPKDFDSLAFYQFNTYLKNTYPLTDSLLDKQHFNQFSHLYKWEGTSAGLPPVILMAHLDVVPVIKENLTDWKQPPFGGKIVNDTLWGRGTIDDKIGVIGILEATEALLKKGFQPQRTLYLSFGHDEELGGQNGAKVIVDHLKEKGVQAEFVLDEGGTISKGIIPGMDKNVALVGIAEKGYVSLELSVKKEGGHSSMPEKASAIDILSAAVVKLKSNPFPAKLAGPTERFIEFLGPEMGLFNRIVFANRWLLSPLITSVYEQSATGNALVRTTTAPTLFHAGIKDNVIPQNAKATVNFRILPGENSDGVMAKAKTIIDDPRITIKKGHILSEPSKVSRTDSHGFQTLRTTIGEIYPETLIAPYLVVGGTDAKHFEPIATDIYRFSPMIIHPGNIKSFHGLNERIAVDDFKKTVQFYKRLIKNSTNE